VSSRRSPEVPSREEVTNRLVSALGYLPPAAERVADRLLSLEGELRASFLSWWESGDLVELSREGFTSADLRGKFGMNPIAALLTLQDLEREPELIAAALHRGLRLAEPPGAQRAPGRGSEP
jgi:hypothetical protein